MNLDELCQGNEELKVKLERYLQDVHSLQTLTTNSYLKGGGDTPQSSDTSTLHDHVDRYEMRELLGQGGFGQVWRAYDPALDREVALKILRPDCDAGPEHLEVLLTEARRAAPLGSHSGIVQVHDVQQRGNFGFIVCELVSGCDLQDWLEENTPTPAEAARIVADVADALHQAHLKGIVHRDVKPRNILLDKDEKVYVTDFGLAVTEEGQLREPGGVCGTFAYLAPEQARGGSSNVDGRTDVYALGVVLYQLLVNRLPFRASSVDDLLTQIMECDPRPPRSIKESVPERLEQVCLRCLKKDKGDRYTTAKDLALALRKEEKPSLFWSFRYALLLLLLLTGSAAAWLLSGPDRKETTSPEPVVVEGPLEHFSTETYQIPLNRWHSLLKYPPKKIYFPDQLTWEKDKPVWINCTTWGMVSFGKVNHPRYQLRIRLQSYNWPKVSLFFGFHYARDTTRNQRKFARYQVIKFSHLGLNEGEGRLRRGMAQDYKLDQLGKFGAFAYLHENWTIQPIRNRTYELVVSVDEKGLRSVEWDNNPPSPRGKARIDRDLMSRNLFQGEFGIHTESASTRVESVELKLLPKP